MSSFNLKDNYHWHSVLLKAALIIVTVAVVVWAMPDDTSTPLYVEQGRPWKYADFTAPFDFPVYKSDEIIKHERDSLLKLYEPYYKYKEETEDNMVRKFLKDYADGIPDVSSEYLTVIANRLHSIYQQGWM